MKQPSLSGLVLALIATCLISAACGTATPAPTPTPAAPGAPADQATRSTGPQDDWTRVQAAGKLLVGTSADYEPFAFYRSDFSLDGFDVALMRLIGQKLNVQVEFKDFAFDTILNTLQLGQVDAVIAAVSITANRQNFVAFSDPYYLSADAVVALPEAAFAIADTADFKDRTVGVERGSLYENWAINNLVNAGLIRPQQLLSYPKVNQAINALVERRVEVVLLDAQPAEAFARLGTVKIIGQNLNRQRLAIAVRQRSTLQAKFNEVIAQLEQSGELQRLIATYLYPPVPEVLPTPTPAPNPTATPVPAALPTFTPAPPPTPLPPTQTPCLDGLQWVQDLTYDDLNMAAPPQFGPGQGFTKAWRVLNTGTCPWNTRYQLVYVQGSSPAAQMSGLPFSLPVVVGVSQNYDIAINLVAPAIPGTYQGFWQMQNAQGIPFGERLSVGLTVIAPATATPLPTQTPAPGISFAVDRTSILAGEPVVFAWDVTNASAVYFYEQGQAWQSYSVPARDARTVYPQRTTIYELRIVSAGGAFQTRQLRVDVQPAPVSAPVIQSFFTQPPAQVAVGNCVNLEWDIRGTVTDVNLYASGSIVWDTAPVRGYTTHCPALVGSQLYVLEAVGPGGTARQSRTLIVVPQ